MKFGNRNKGQYNTGGGSWNGSVEINETYSTDEQGVKDEDDDNNDDLAGGADRDDDDDNEAGSNLND